MFSWSSLCFQRTHEFLNFSTYIQNRDKTYEITVFIMTARDRVRESVARDRQHDDRLRANMLERTESDGLATEERELAESARERLTEMRQHDDLRQDAMSERASAEIGLAADDDAEGPVH